MDKATSLNYKRSSESKGGLGKDDYRMAPSTFQAKLTFCLVVSGRGSSFISRLPFRFSVSVSLLQPLFLGGLVLKIH